MLVSRMLTALRRKVQPFTWLVVRCEVDMSHVQLVRSLSSRASVLSRSVTFDVQSQVVCYEFVRIN